MIKMIIPTKSKRLADSVVTIGRHPSKTNLFWMFVIGNLKNANYQQTGGTGWLVIESSAVWLQWIGKPFSQFNLWRGTYGKSNIMGKQFAKIINNKIIYIKSILFFFVRVHDIPKLSKRLWFNSYTLKHNLK